MGPSKSGEGTEDCLVKQFGCGAGRNAVEHFAEDDAADAFELAGVAQLPEHAIDLIGLGAGVFEEEQLAFGLRLPLVPSRDTRMLRQPP